MPSTERRAGASPPGEDVTSVDNLPVVPAPSVSVDEGEATARHHDPEAVTLIEPKDAAPTTSAKVELPKEDPKERSISGTRTGGTIAHTTNATVLASPLSAMHSEEIKRTRAFARIIVPFSLAVLGLVPFLGGDPTAKAVFAVTLVFACGAAAWIVRVLRDDAAYTVNRALFFGVISVITGFAGIYYFGIFSPAAAMIPFGLYFFSVGQSFRGTLGIYLACALLELGIGGAIIAGVLEDRGLVRAPELAWFTKLAIVMLVEGVFFATLLIARASRRAILHSIEEHDRAVRGLLQREELLKEAKLELERALEIGGLGRFTDEVLGKFRLGHVLGRGGMGEVYEAVNVDTHEPAAVKLLHGHALGDPEHVRRFLREAKIAASFDVPNVVRVFEIGGLDARLPYIAMERLRGQDLAEILREQRRLSIPKVITLVREVGQGLDAAREAGIVHRDLKPRNLYRAEGAGRPIWKILDFGVSRLLAEQGTLTGEQMLGTPSYMAPEQVASGKVDHRADLYSLGVICYRALTGRPAVSGDQVAEILYKVVHTMPTRPTDSARVHEDVDAALAIALAKSPEDRFDHASELAAALEAAARGSLSEALRARAAKILAKHPWTPS